MICFKSLLTYYIHTSKNFSKMPDSSKGRIDKLLSYVGNDILVGCTCDTLSIKLLKYKSCLMCDKNKDHVITFIMNELGFDFSIWNNINDLKARTSHYIREFSTLNKQQLKQMSKIHYDKNKEDY